MGAIQNAFNTVVGTGIVASALLKKKQALAEKSMQDAKLARLTQRAKMEKQRAIYQKSKLQKLQAKQGISQLKAGGSNITIGGAKVTNPELLKKLQGGK